MRSTGMVTRLLVAAVALLAWGAAIVAVLMQRPHPGEFESPWNWLLIALYVYLPLCGVVGAVARSKRRSVVLWSSLAVLFNPVVVIWFLLARPRVGEAREVLEGRATE